MARDLQEQDYYVSKGGKIPVKWTAPEVSKFVNIDCVNYCIKSDNCSISGSTLQEVLHCQ